MRYITTGTQMQAIDAYTINELEIPSMVLMERAALSVAQIVSAYLEELELTGQPRILIVTEGGNNGGDGLAVARILNGYGYDTDVWQIGGVTHETDQYRRQKQILERLEIQVHQGVTETDLQMWKQPRYDVIIDGIFGVGLHREIRSPQREVIRCMNELGGLKCAIDIPSGIDSTDGHVYGIGFRADVTVTFGCEKTGQLIGKGPEYCGDLVLADIGFPAQAVSYGSPVCYAYEDGDQWRYLPERNRSGNKGTFGKVTVVAGSESICGAALLSAEAAYRSGCGLVEIITHQNNREAIQERLPEALLQVYSNQEEAVRLLKKAEGWADAIVIGPGIGTGEIGQALTRTALELDRPLIVDADAITNCSEMPELLQLRTGKAGMILTPHMKEMERLSGVPVSQFKQAPWKYAQEFADEKEAVCVLKDARTVVAVSGETQCYINLSGNDGMATGGSGDALTGIIASFLVQGLSLAEAARTGVYIHGLAGDAAAEKKGHRGMLAGDIILGLEEVLL